MTPLKDTLKTYSEVITPTVLVSALGYFVDIYDLLLFGIVRVASLRDIGVPEERLLDVGIYLMNTQMAGMLVGGILWGILGDKRGRVSVLFGSILIYSLANIANSFAHSVEVYAALRFFAGIGLAGELGAAITLVSETLHREKRGLGTTVVAAVGILGAVFAGLIGDHFTWQTSYLIGGLMGLALLVMRMSIFESGMFEAVKSSVEGGRRGDFRVLFHTRERAGRYLRCILVGVPIWFIVGILITFSPELAKSLAVEGKISAGKAILYSYAGLSLGDFCSGWLSQVFKTRRWVILFFLLLCSGLVGFYLLSAHLSVGEFYALCSALGFASGYWAVFMTVAAEQFGTNIRATATTTVPNFVRGSVVILTSAFHFLSGSVGIIPGAAIVGGVSLAIAVYSVLTLNETFGKNLDYVEGVGL